jgi:ABC-2 type transport system permease protein
MMAMLLSQVLVFGVLLFSPVNYPAERMPEWMQTIHSVLPVQAMAEVIRGSLASDTFRLTAGPVLLLAVWCAISLGLSWMTLRRRA